LAGRELAGHYATRMQMSLHQHGLPVRRMNAAFKLCSLILDKLPHISILQYFIWSLPERTHLLTTDEQIKGCYTVAIQQPAKTCVFWKCC